PGGSVDVYAHLGAVGVHRVPVGGDGRARAHQLVPRHAGPLRRHLDHRDAALDGADQAAEVAADAVLLPYARLRALAVGPDAGLEAGAVTGQRGRVDAHAVDREVYALVRALVAGDVAEVALDALALVDARDGLERQVEVAEVGDAVRRRPHDLRDALDALRVEPVRETVDEVLDDPEAVVHHGRADLHRRGAEQQELGRVAPGLDPAHAGDRHAGGPHLGVDGHLREHVQRDRLHRRAGVAAVAALAADVRTQLERVEVDADDRVDRVYERQAVGPPGDRGARRLGDVGDVRRQLDDHGDLRDVGDPARDQRAVLGDLPQRGAHAALRHAVRTAVVQLDRVGAGVLDLEDDVAPRLRGRRDHRRHDDGAVRPEALDLGDLPQVHLERPVGDQLDVVDREELLAAHLERAVAVADVQDGVADRLPDGAAPAVLEGLVDLVGGVRGRRRGQPEGVRRPHPREHRSQVSHIRLLPPPWRAAARGSAGPWAHRAAWREPRCRAA